MLHYWPHSSSAKCSPQILFLLFFFLSQNAEICLLLPGNVIFHSMWVFRLLRLIPSYMILLDKHAIFNAPLIKHCHWNIHAVMPKVDRTRPEWEGEETITCGVTAAPLLTAAAWPSYEPAFKIKVHWILWFTSHQRPFSPSVLAFPSVPLHPPAVPAGLFRAITLLSVIACFAVFPRRSFPTAAAAHRCRLTTRRMLNTGNTFQYEKKCSLSAVIVDSSVCGSDVGHCASTHTHTHSLRTF